jgi:hypothetical protein
MFKAVVLLGFGCAWLAAERYSLNEKMAAMEGKVETMRRENSNLDAKVAAMEGRAVGQAPGQPIVTAVPPKTWLQDRIENHSSLSRLEPAGAESGGSRAYVRPRYYGVYPSTTVNYNNTYNIAPRTQPAPTPLPAKLQQQRPVSR